MTKKEIENLESMYLNEFYHFLKFAKRRMLNGFKTKEEIKSDWIEKWNPDEASENKGISSFAVGAERIVYALFNNQGFGQPNSAPIGSDLFFETDDAFIHIDLKTVQTRNIGDYTNNIFVGDNQNSYNVEIKQANGKSFNPPRKYSPALPYKYSKGNKPCLTFFITILYDENNLDILCINILSMPNGILSEEYGSDVVRAGKNPGKIRFNFSKSNEFRLLEGKPKRIKVVYLNPDIKEKYLKKMSFIKEIYNSQDNEGC